MPLLKRAAPKWKKILMGIGIKKEALTGMAEQKVADQELLLKKGMIKWLKQEQASPQATLATLADALDSPEVGEGAVAADIVNGIHYVSHGHSYD